MFTTRPELAGTFGMVSSTHWLASAAGMAVLESGGNAFDAAAAAGFVLHVVEPHLNGPGGEMPAIFATADDPTPRVLCAQGVAPAGATIAHYRDQGLDVVPGTGLLAATVPGAVGGWLALLRDHGTRSLREVLDYAIGYAAHGHPLVARVGTTVATVADMFRSAWPTSAALWLPGNRPPGPGEMFANPVLADTYRRLLAEAEAAGADREAQLEAAHRAWYSGFVAEAVDAFCRREFVDDSGAAHAGVLTGADLAGWRPSYELPVRTDWQGMTVCKVGGWSQGPVLLSQLAMLDSLGDLPAHGSAELVHTAVEIAKLAFADREAWYGDVPDVPVDALLSADYARARAGLVGGTASLLLRPGSPDGRQPRLPRYVLEQRGDGAVGAGVGEPTIDPRADGAAAGGPATRVIGAVGTDPMVGPTGVTRGDTCHVDVVDRWGNMISATPSGGWLQSSPTIPELGFCLGTRAQMFWLEEGLPASLAPGRRPRITLSPSFALRDGRPFLAFGTPGGDQQDQWQLCFLLARAAGMNLQEAIDAPAWHTTAFPSSFYPRRAVPGEVVVESRLGTEVLDDLARRGHRVTVAGDWMLGRMCAVSRDPDTGVLRAAANPRGMQGYAVGR